MLNHMIQSGDRSHRFYLWLYFFRNWNNMQLLKNFEAQAIIFDKDGTLIDFDFMWGRWTLQLAERLQTVTGRTCVKRYAHLTDTTWPVEKSSAMGNSPVRQCGSCAK